MRDWLAQPLAEVTRRLQDPVTTSSRPRRELRSGAADDHRISEESPVRTADRRHAFAFSLQQQLHLHAPLLATSQKWGWSAHIERSDIVGQKKEEIRLVPRPHLLPPPAIRIDGLSFSYGPTEAPILDRMDLDIPNGGFVAIVGPSGSGKTTLMRLMLGLLQPSAGQILIDGVPLGPATAGSWRSRLAPCSRRHFDDARSPTISPSSRPVDESRAARAWRGPRDN